MLICISVINAFAFSKLIDKTNQQQRGLSGR